MGNMENTFKKLIEKMKKYSTSSKELLMIMKENSGKAK